MTDLEIVRATVQACVEIEHSSSAALAIQAALAAARACGMTTIDAVTGPVQDEVRPEQVLHYACPLSRFYFTEGLGRYDPFVLRGLRAAQPVTVEEIKGARLSGPERAALNFVEQNAEHRHGLVVPVRHRRQPTGVVVFRGGNAYARAAQQAALTLLGHCIFARLCAFADARDPRGKPGAGLSEREREVLSWVAKGKCDSEIAIICDIAERTARFHVANAKAKLAATSRVQAVTRARELGLIAV